MLVLARRVAFVDSLLSHLRPGPKVLSAVLAEQGSGHQRSGNYPPALGSGSAKPSPGPVFTLSPSSLPSSHYNLCV